MGKYELIDEIGIGGMGRVYKARQKGLERIVALKVIRAEYATREDVLARFQREAAVCARFNHPNVIKLYDFGKEDDVCYYAMEYLGNAVNFDEYLEDHGGVADLTMLVAMGQQLCSALTHLHEQDVIHRDLKPANIMVGTDGHVTLMDFGLVRPLDESAITREGRAIGTPRYMAPEQLRSDTPDARTDIFQLGLVLYEGATGKQAFDGKDVFAVAHNILREAPPLPSSIRPELPQAFDDAVMTCLHKHRDDRFQSAAHLSAALATLLEPTEGTASPSGSAPPLTPATGPATGAQSADGIAETGTFSSFHASNTVSATNSSLTLRKQQSLRHILAAVCGAIFCLVLVAALYMSGKAPLITALDVTVQDDLDCAKLTWRTAHPCLSVVEVTDPKEPEHPPKRFTNDDAGETNQHEVVVTNLPTGRTFHASIVYPDGRRSLPKKIGPFSTDELSLARWTATFESFTSHVVQWQTNVPCRCTVSFTRRGRALREVVSPTAVLRHRFVLDEVGFDETVADVQVELESLRHRERIPWGDIHGPAKTVAKLLKACKEFQTAHYVESLRNSLRSLPRAAQQEQAASLIHRLLEMDEAWKLLQRHRTLLAPTFSSPTVSLTTYKLPLYHGLRKFDSLDALLDWLKLPRAIGAIELYRPFVDLTHSRDMPPGTALPLVEIPMHLAAFLPMHYAAEGRDGAISKDLLNIYGDHGKGTEREVTAAVDLTRFLEGCGPRVTIVARVRNVTPEIFLRLTINGSYDIELRNLRETSPPNQWLAGFTPDMGETPEYLASTNFLIAKVPRALFTPGRNSFVAGFHLVPTVGSVHIFQLRGIWLIP